MKKVMVFGTFDILHPGHLIFLKKAKNLGQKLYVVVAHDANVKKIKNSKPYLNTAERMFMMSQLKPVDVVIKGSRNNPYSTIKRVRPDILVLGHDQKNFVDKLPDLLKKIRLNSKIIRFGPVKNNRYKSSKLKNHYAKH